MKIESITFKNFRCFGPEQVKLDLVLSTTALIGPNGAGKTAALLGLLRLFGPTEEVRRVRPSDFHVPLDEHEAPASRKLAIEAVIGFPELVGATPGTTKTVPPFFMQMAAKSNGSLKLRIVLEAEWHDDGSTEGVVDSRYRVIRTLKAKYDPDRDCSDLSAVDRARIQVVYVPASRDPASQVSNLLKSRLWKAISWSAETKKAVEGAASDLSTAFDEEPAITRITKSIHERWLDLHGAGTDAKPAFRPLDRRFEDFIRKVELVLQHDEQGNDRGLSHLSDGQRSMLHIAMTAAVLDLEAELAKTPSTDFVPDRIAAPALTLIALEEPENCLTPFYLSRILSQVGRLADGPHAQAVISSHSPSILGRIPPESIRHFRLDRKTRRSEIKSITLPSSADESGKFVREAVRAYPELYFARAVILCEGPSEEIVLPRIAEALDLDIERSFVSIVPLGGRHVVHFWRLLRGLGIPHLTLLDYDLGRHGGGWGRIKSALEHLLEFGVPTNEITDDKFSDETALRSEITKLDTKNGGAAEEMKEWRKLLQGVGVFYSFPLDVDFAMLRAFPGQYRQVHEPGGYGPSGKDARSAVFGEKGQPERYKDTFDEDFRWYRYLFLGRGKPTTHLRALTQISNQHLKENAPPALRLLMKAAVELLKTSNEEDDGDEL